MQLFDWDVLPFPKGPQDSRVGVDATGYGMSADSKHPKAAWQLIQFLTGEAQQKEVAASGLIVPARRTVAEGSVFNDLSQKPEHDQVFLDVIESGVPSHVPPRWTEFEEQLSNLLEPVWDGKLSPEEAFTRRNPP